MAFESSASLSIAKDFDTGAGIDNAPVQGIYLPSSGGGVIGGTATNPIRIDPTGTTSQPITAASLPLPAGAATAALQTQPGVDIGDVTINNGAGASAVNIQDGGNSITIDGLISAAQSGAWTVTANAGTNLNTSFLALESTQTDGTAKAINRGGAKGATTAADITSTAQGADHQALDIQIYHGGGAINPTSIRALTSSDTVTVVQSTAADLKMDLSGSAANSTAGLLSVKIDQTTDGTTNKVAATQATASNLNAQVVGNIANGSSDSGNPVKIGGVGRTTNPTAVSDGQRVNGFFDAAGKQVVIMNGPRDLRVEGEVALTATTAETTLIAAGGAGVFHDIEYLLITDTSVTGARLDFRDNTGGTIRFRVNTPGTGAIGTATFMPPRPVKQTTANKNWTVQSSASVTSIYVFYEAIKVVV